MGKEVSAKKQRKSKQSGFDAPVKVNVVNSKIEHTKPTDLLIGEEARSRTEKISDAASEYRQNIANSGTIVRQFVEKECKGNLLKMKLVLWSALQEIEKAMKDRR